MGFQFWGSQIWRQILNFRGNCGWGGNSRIIVAFIQLLPPRTTRWEPATFLMVDVATCTFCAEHGRRERQDQRRTIVYIVRSTFVQPGRTRIARSTPLLGGVSSSGPNGWSFLAVVGIYVATPCFQNHPLSNSRIYLGGSRG